MRNGQGSGAICGGRKKKGDDIREEVDVAAKNKQSREEDEIVWSFFRSGVIGRKVRSCVLIFREMLRLHNDYFCNAAMQREHGAFG